MATPVALSEIGEQHTLLGFAVLAFDSSGSWQPFTGVVGLSVNNCGNR